MRTIGILLLPLALASADELSRKAEAVLKKNCLTCHGAALKSSGLDLRTREAMIQGGERGSALMPGHPETSRLYLFASGTEQPSMPPGNKLGDADLAILRQWIKEGAKIDAITPETEDRLATLARMEERPILPEERAFWSFRPVKRPATKSVGSKAIDELWRAALTAKGLAPNPRADKRSLIRRAYLDLIGLPPTPAEVKAFVDNPSPDAWPKLIDHLLASPHYGERWGRHWLDLARYADSGGYEYDRDRPNAALYRDWVVRALNADLPYDEFLRVQIAGDEFYPANRDAVIATSFLRLGPEANIKTAQTRADELDDILQTVGGSVIGMTIGCARCHNHKFDPIPQKDYYRMQAVFFSAKPAEVPVVDAEAMARNKEAVAAWELEIKPVRDELAAFEKPFRDRILADKRSKFADYIKVALATPPEKRTEGQRLNAIQVEKTLTVTDDDWKAYLSADETRQRDALKAKVASHEKRKPQLETAMSVKEPGRDAEQSHFLHHGSVDSPGTVMKPGILSVAHDGEWEFPLPSPDASSSWRRRGFAQWIASPSNPLTARVMVNRIWQHHFGEGLVRTVSNFGKTGERPSHPELLDWLASEFVQQGWSLKKMHRQILLTEAYQMSSTDNEAGLKVDPENRLLWRQARPRLEAEIIRDNIMAVAGTLSTKIGGPGVHPYIDPSLFSGSSGRTWPGKAIDDPATFRRSIYVFQKRTIPVPMMELFDAPNGIGACARRNRSTVATQALILMNNAFVHDQAKRFAQRLEREAGADPAAQVALAFELALSRAPSAKERAEGVSFIRASGLHDFAHAVFNLNEFAYVP